MGSHDNNLVSSDFNASRQTLARHMAMDETGISKLRVQRRRNRAEVTGVLGIVTQHYISERPAPPVVTSFRTTCSDYLGLVSLSDLGTLVRHCEV